MARNTPWKSDRGVPPSSCGPVMTYRKLFLLTLVASTLLTVVAWAHSLWSCSRVSGAWGGTAPFSEKLVFGSLAYGTVTLGYREDGSCFLPFMATSTPLSDMPTEDRPEAWGRFHLGKASAFGFHPDDRMDLVEFPVWFPWLLFTAGTLVLLLQAEHRREQVSTSHQDPSKTP